MLNTLILLLNNDIVLSTIIEALIDYIISSPDILISVGLAYVSGNLWICIFYPFFPENVRKFLCSNIGKIGLGLLWFALVLLVIYIIVYKNIIINRANLKEILITVLSISLALQAIIYFLYRKGQKK